MADVTLSKISNYMVKLPGYPEFVEISNTGKKTIVLDVLWMTGKHNKYKPLLKKHTDYCSVKVQVVILCRNASYETTGIYYGLTFQLPNIPINIKDICQKCKTGNFTGTDKSNGFMGCRSKESTGLVEAEHPYKHQESRF